MFYRKNYTRSIESIQTSLDSEIKARSDAYRAKKKFETQLNDAEMQLEHTTRCVQEQSKMMKKLQTVNKVQQRCFKAVTTMVATARTCGEL